MIRFDVQAANHDQEADPITVHRQTREDAEQSAALLTECGYREVAIVPVIECAWDPSTERYSECDGRVCRCEAPAERVTA